MPKICGERLYEIQNTLGMLKLIVPINSWDNKIQIQLQTTDTTKMGIFSANLEVSLVTFTTVKTLVVTFSINIYLMPYFDPKLPNVISLYMTSSPKPWSMKFPKIVDKNVGAAVFLSINFGFASDFIILNGEKQTIEISDLSGENSKIRPGLFSLTCTLDDSLSKPGVYSLPILIFASLVKKEDSTASVSNSNQS